MSTGTRAPGYPPVRYCPGSMIPDRVPDHARCPWKNRKNRKRSISIYKIAFINLLLCVWILNDNTKNNLITSCFCCYSLYFLKFSITAINSFRPLAGALAIAIACHAQVHLMRRAQWRGALAFGRKWQLIPFRPLAGALAIVIVRRAQWRGALTFGRKWQLIPFRPLAGALAIAIVRRAQWRGALTFGRKCN